MRDELDAGLVGRRQSGRGSAPGSAGLFGMLLRDLGELGLLLRQVLPAAALSYVELLLRVRRWRLLLARRSGLELGGLAALRRDEQEPARPRTIASDERRRQAADHFRVSVMSAARLVA